MSVKRRPTMPSENASDGILLWAYNTDARTYSGLTKIRTRRRSRRQYK
ncbi:TPA: hypothetical protein WHF02_001867 [Neisseria meningitidis]